MPLSYLNPNYREHSAFAGSGRVISGAGLAHPGLNHTGGRRSRTTRARKLRRSRLSRRSRRGGFYHSVMGSVLSSGPKLIPVAAVTGYRMCKNYKGRTKRKQRR
jgi:hypothetical protein